MKLSNIAKTLLFCSLFMVCSFTTAAFSAEVPAADATVSEAVVETATAATTTFKMPDNARLATAIQHALDDNKINAADAPGFLGIPGGPEVNPILAFAWAIWVGWIFSTVGAFGGVMAGVGHMSVFGLGGYASSFGKGTEMNKLVTDSIRVSNQWLVGISSLVSSFKYARLGRIVLPLGVALGIGSLAGSILVPTLTQGKVSFKEYQGYFGLFVLLLGCYLLYETTKWAQAKRKKAAAAAKAFEEASKNSSVECKIATGVKITSISISRVVFTFCGVEFSFNTIVPVLGGFLIAAMASFLGVGGGFLLVPFLTSVAQLPMYLAAGTSAFAVLVGMVTSISTFMFGGTPVFWPLVGLELGGIVIGSWIGPMTAKYLPDAWLKRIFIVLAFVVGCDFIMRGFFGSKLF